MEASRFILSTILGHPPREDRDRAMISLGFGGAFRASDLAGLDTDVHFTDAGVVLDVRRSETQWRRIRACEGRH